ncbi:MAG TPA: DUF4331 family protein [Candidatus Dormibacteraeota bacterium]|nr:DUF4331 family protein [Candidatus Dormibacteraeota bacterium]
MQRPSLRTGGLLGAAALILAIGGAPLLVSGADHIDAPALGHTSSGSSVDLLSTHGDRDINDVYVFNDAARTRTVFAMTTNPAVNVPTVDAMVNFGTNVRYVINVDRTGDAVQDLAFVWRFGAAGPNGQPYSVWRYTGANARSLAHGVQIGSGWTSGTGIGTARGNAKVFAGVRADPFFFDLLGFLGTVLHVGSAQLGNCGSSNCDFFAPLNTNAMVLEVPNDSIGATNIGVWGTTSYWESGAWHQADQMGRPAINTVFNNKYVAGANVGAQKDLFNTTPPSQQNSPSLPFHGNIVGTLENINGLLGTGCADYNATTANAIANFLLPDVLTYKVGSKADGTVFNGRALSDDVIDAELGVTTNGCVTSDNANASGHTYLSSFPYLGVPN